jgi:GntR family transcriptional repressor for pyruvate dehydrogenase complex
LLVPLPASSPDALDKCVSVLELLVVEKLEPGQQLPSELDLSVSMGLSRVTVREALKVLSGRGLVELRKGTRAVVREPDASVLSDFLSVAIRRDPRGLLDLVEVRRALEVQAVSSAASHATRASIAAVEAAFRDMEKAAEAGNEADLERYHHADVVFHEALALASGNRMLAFILEGLAGALEYSFRRSADVLFARGGSFEEALDSHRRILDFVVAGDAHGAAEAMQAHLRLAAQDMARAIQAF